MLPGGANKCHCSWKRYELSSSAINPLDSKDNYSATSNNTKLVQWRLMGELLHLVERGGAWAGWGLGGLQPCPGPTSLYQM